MITKVSWFASFLFFGIASYSYASLAFNTKLLNTGNPDGNPWIPVISSVISLGFAILAFLREKRKK